MHSGANLDRKNRTGNMPAISTFLKINAMIRIRKSTQGLISRKMGIKYMRLYLSKPRKSKKSIVKGSIKMVMAR